MLQEPRTTPENSDETHSSTAWQYQVGPNSSLAGIGSRRPLPSNAGTTATFGIVRRNPWKRVGNAVVGGRPVQLRPHPIHYHSIRGITRRAECRLPFASRHFGVSHFCQISRQPILNQQRFSRNVTIDHSTVVILCSIQNEEVGVNRRGVRGLVPKKEKSASLGGHRGTRQSHSN